MLLGVPLLLDRIALNVIRPPRLPILDQPSPGRHVVTDVEIPSEYTLQGWLIEPAVAIDGPVIILSHGWGTNSGMVVPLAGAAGSTPVVIGGAGHTDILERPETLEGILSFLRALPGR